MKINIRTSIIGATIVVILAFCETSDAQSYSISGWGMIPGEVGGTGNWAITEGSPGDFSVGTGTLSAGAAWAARFPWCNLAPGLYIEVTGQFTITGSVGGSGPFRFGLFNENGHLGTLSSGVWSGSWVGWTGYLFTPPTYGYNPGGSGEFSGRVNGTGPYPSVFFNSYGFGTSSANPGSIGDDTYTFDLKLTQETWTTVRMDYSIAGSGATPYTESGFVTDSGGAATGNTSYDAVGFFLANPGTAATELAFKDIQITPVIPEPASMGLLSCGLLGLLTVCRFRVK